MDLRAGGSVMVNGQFLGILGNYNITRELNFDRYTIEVTTQKNTVSQKVSSAVSTVEAIFGNPRHRKPYRGNLVGNIRIKYRIDDYAKMYVRDPHRIRCYLLKDMGDYVTHGIELEQTHRTQPRTPSEPTS